MLGNTPHPQPVILKRNVTVALLLCVASCFTPLWAAGTGLPTSEETPIGGMRAPLVSMLEPDSRLSLPQQRLPRGVLPHVFKQGSVPTPELTWATVPQTQVALPMVKLFVVFARWSLEGG